MPLGFVGPYAYYNLFTANSAPRVPANNKERKGESGWRCIDSTPWECLKVIMLKEHFKKLVYFAGAGVGAWMERQK